jgi:DNA repair exonuclease SbcCD nuclease subunit
MGITILNSLTDSHWSENRPSSRRDPDWISTQTGKIQFLFNFSRTVTIRGQQGAAAILHGGDLFHQPRGPLISRRVDQWLYQILRESPCPILAVPGNHDMQGHHLDSLENHPYGCLAASEVIFSAIWPNYFLVGQDPLVLVTGRQFVPEGAGPWLDELKEYRTLDTLKQDIQDQYGVSVYNVILSHAYWGEKGGEHYGEPVTAYGDIEGTGIDVLIFGHDHSCNGIHPVETDEGFKYVVGPGAFVRGTIGETDLWREPKIVVLGMESAGHHEITLVSVPHQPADEVFNLDLQAQRKRKRDREMMFIEECRKIECKSPTIEVVLASMVDRNFISPRVIPLVREYISRATDQGEAGFGVI